MGDVHTACVMCHTTNTLCDLCRNGRFQRYNGNRRRYALAAFLKLPVLSRFLVVLKNRFRQIDTDAVELFAWLKSRPSRDSFESSMLIQGCFVDLPHAHLLHILHMFQMLKIVQHAEPVLKALARQTMFKLVLQGEYTFEDQELMVLAFSMCTLVQNLVTVM